MSEQVDPKELRTGDWFVWHELKPVRYRLVKIVADDDGVTKLIAEDERNLAEFGPGEGFPSLPVNVSVADRRFERALPPEAFRPTLPEEIGTMILAHVLAGGALTVALAILADEGSCGPIWTEVGSGEWFRPESIVDFRTLDGIDTVRPKGGAS